MVVVVVVTGALAEPATALVRLELSGSSVCFTPARLGPDPGPDPGAVHVALTYAPVAET